MKFFARNQIQQFSLPRTKLKTEKQQKNNRLFRRNNRLFIPVIYQQLKLKSLRKRELISQKPLGNPLGNQIQITYTHHQRSDLDPLKTHTSFGSAHTSPRMLILTTSRAHNPSWLYNTKMYTNHRTNYTVTESTEINTE